MKIVSVGVSQVSAAAKFEIATHVLHLLSRSLGLKVEDSHCTRRVRLAASLLGNNLRNAQKLSPKKTTSPKLAKLFELLPNNESIWYYYVKACWSAETRQESGLILLSLFLTEILLELLFVLKDEESNKQNKQNKQNLTLALSYFSVASIVMVSDIWTMQLQAGYLASLSDKSKRRFAELDDLEGKSAAAIHRLVREDARGAAWEAVTGVVIMAAITAAQKKILHRLLKLMQPHVDSFFHQRDTTAEDTLRKSLLYIVDYLPEEARSKVKGHLFKLRLLHHAKRWNQHWVQRRLVQPKIDKFFES